MEWHPAQLSWDQQMFVLWVLLPPVFIFCGFLAFLAPMLYRDQEAGNQAKAGVSAKQDLAEKGA